MGPIIVSGCSYGGSLAIWFRSKYPHLVSGTIAKSPPLEAKTEISEFTDHVEKVARKSYAKCIKDLEYYVPAMKDMVKNQPNQYLRQNN